MGQLQILEGEGSKSFRNEDTRESKLGRFSLNSLKNVIGGLSACDIVSQLEPFIQDVVKDEVDRALRSFIEHPTERSLLPAVETSEAEVGLGLRFIGSLPETIFTGSKILTKDGNSTRIELYDPRTNNIVTSGPLSSVKIEILVLDGDFDQENWDEKYFNGHIVRQREGKRPLLNGDCCVALQRGACHVGDLVFTDNSSWVRSRKFRLGARALQKKNGAEVRVREARSETFMVKDHRGELYKKHHPPHLSDEVWRLEKISRDGTFHRRLTLHGIHSVKDLLRLYETDPVSLRNILGSAVPNKTWEAIVEHANTCVIDDNKFFGYKQDHHNHGLVFNSVYKVVGATFDGQCFMPLDGLTPNQKRMKKQALKNPQNLFPVDAFSTISPPRLLPDSRAHPLLPVTRSSFQSLEFPIPFQDQLEITGEFSHSSTSTSHSSIAPETQSLVFPAFSQQNQFHSGIVNTKSGNSCISGEFQPGESSTAPDDSHGYSVEGENVFQVQTQSWFH